MMHIQTLRPYFLMLFLVGTFALTTAIFLPFLKPLALAAVFAVVLQGLYQRVSKLLGGWSSTAALLTVIVSVFAILLPLSLVGVLVGNEARSLYTSLEAQGGESTIAQMILRVDETFSGVIPGLGEFSHTASVDINTYTKEALQWITATRGRFSQVSPASSSHSSFSSSRSTTFCATAARTANAHRAFAIK